MLHARASADPTPSAERVDWKSGWRSQATISGSIARIALQMRDRLVAEADRLAVVEVADILRHERLAPARQRDRVLEIGAGGEHARAVGAEVDRLGDEAARAAHEGRRAVEDAHHRIVGAHDDLARRGRRRDRRSAPRRAARVRRRRRSAVRRRNWRWWRRARDSLARMAPAPRSRARPASACKTSQCSGV